MCKGVIRMKSKLIFNGPYKSFFNLYKYNNMIKTNIKEQEELEIKEFVPTLFKLYHEYEKKNFRTTIFRIYLSILTANKSKIYMAIDKHKHIYHKAYVICKNFKYPFLNKDEIVIGPCSTIEQARGKGIYPYVLNYIIKNGDYKSYYLIIRPENISSINGAKKAGFNYTNRNIYGTKFLNRFIEK